MIWTACDEVGLTIAKHAAAIPDSTTTRFIERNDFVFMTIHDYKQWLQSQRPHQQEQQLGGVQQWHK